MYRPFTGYNLRDKVRAGKTVQLKELEMKRLAIPALWALLVIVPALAEAQAPQPAPDNSATNAAPGNTSPAKPVISAAARARLRPFTKDMVAKVDYVEAVRNCDKTVLNADCEAFVRRANERHNLGLNLTNMSQARVQLADIMEDSLIEVPCFASQEGIFDAVRANGQIEPNGIRRKTLPGERCLAFANTGACFASLMCGNFCGDGVQPVLTREIEKQAALPPPVGPTPEEIRKLVADELAKSQPAQSARENWEGNSREQNHVQDPRSFWDRYKKPILIGAGTAAVVGTVLGVWKPVKMKNIQNNY
jgi:hypothetical protein